MATWAIGDVHGRWHELSELLAVVRPGDHDTVWLVGDLVNRGPDSLAVLRWAAGSGDRVVAVLGNHDLYLLARAEGLAAPEPRDTLEPVLEAPDRDDLLAWLRMRPLLHREGDRVLVHAGLWPSWGAADAEAAAREAEGLLAAGTALLARLASGEIPSWSPELAAEDRAHAAAAILTNLRAVLADGRPWQGVGPPEALPAGAAPWFRRSRAVAERVTVVFGHWARLGLRLEPGVVALDSGCVHGGALTAVCLEDRRVVRVPCRRSPAATRP